MVKIRFHLDRKAHHITPRIKIKSEHKDMVIDINRMRIGLRITGVETAGWMNKHVLWNRPTLQASVADLDKINN